MYYIHTVGVSHIHMLFKDLYTSTVLCKQIFACYQKGIYKFARF